MKLASVALFGSFLFRVLMTGMPRISAMAGCGVRLVKLFGTILTREVMTLTGNSDQGNGQNKDGK